LYLIIIILSALTNVSKLHTFVRSGDII